MGKECDEKFWEDDLNDEGNAFAKYYYESNTYISGSESVLAEGLPTLYHVKDSWENYQKIARVISGRYIKWRNSQGKKWWQFWK